MSHHLAEKTQLLRTGAETGLDLRVASIERGLASGPPPPYALTRALSLSRLKLSPPSLSVLDMMNVSFTRNSPFNTTVLDSRSCEPMLTISTPFRMCDRTTTIVRDRGASEKGSPVVAEIDWRCISQSILRYGTQTMPMNEFLVPSGTLCLSVFSPLPVDPLNLLSETYPFPHDSNRTFQTPSGRRCTWKSRGCHWIVSQRDCANRSVF